MIERLLSGRPARLVLYRADTGASIDTAAVGVSGGGALDERPERVKTAAGTYRVVGYERSVDAVVSDALVIEQLETWRRDRALVLGYVLGRAESAHRIWAEPVRVDLTAADATEGLVGKTLTLATAKYSASVALSDDLNALASWRDTTGDGVADDYALVVTGGDGLAAPAFTGAGPTGWQSLTAAAGEVAYFYRDVVLPAPGLRVRLSTLLTGGACGDFLLDDPADDASVSVRLLAYSFGPVPSPVVGLGRAPLDDTEEFVTAEGEASAWLTLPPKTYAVRMMVTVKGGTAGLGAIRVREPHLFTRAEPAESVLNGGFLDRGESADTLAWKIEAFGTATDEEAVTTLTFRATTYDSASSSRSAPARSST